MPPALATIEADFDRLATIGDDHWGHNTAYHGSLLRRLPARLDAVLEIGCGAGVLTRLLADRATRVVGVDLSGRMLDRARARCAGLDHVSFMRADIAGCDFGPAAFDSVVSIATFHHLSFEPVVTAIERWLRPGGTLLVLDVLDRRGPFTWPVTLLAMGASAALRLRNTGRLRDTPERRAAWAEHGRRERYWTAAQTRAAWTSRLPGVVVREHLLWRYSATWTKPAF